MHTNAPCLAALRLNAVRAPPAALTALTARGQWYFGKTLAEDPAFADVPIGLVGTFVGGTFIEQWVRQERQAACSQTLCGTSNLEHYKCGSLFNGHIAPFVNSTISGLLWCE